MQGILYYVHCILQHIVSSFCRPTRGILVVMINTTSIQQASFAEIRLIFKLAFLTPFCTIKQSHKFNSRLHCMRILQTYMLENVHACECVRMRVHVCMADTLIETFQVGLNTDAHDCFGQQGECGCRLCGLQQDAIINKRKISTDINYTVQFL